MGRHELDPLGLGLLQMADSCECANEPSDSIKCGEFFAWLRSCLLFKKYLAVQILLLRLYVCITNMTASQCL